MTQYMITQDVIPYFVSFAVFYVRRKCYVVFACCRVLVVRALICSWFETTCLSRCG